MFVVLQTLVMPKVNFERLLFNTPRILWHVVFWLVYILFFTVVYGSFEEDYVKQLYIQLTDAYVQIPATYLVLYVLMPRYLFKDKIGGFFAYLSLVIFVFSALIWVNYSQLQHDWFWPNDEHDPPFWNWGKVFKNTTKIYPVVFLGIVAKWFKYWYQQQKTTQKLAEEKLQAELKFLKAQVHPHFLFNTLNNLYALTLKKSKDAPEVVLKLSDLLNYMLYDCSADRILLEKEVKLLKDYIDLEKIRYGDRLTVNMSVSGSLSGIKLSPLLILPFVENAFKHGVSEALDESWINIDLSVSKENLTLKVENSKSILESDQDRFDYKKGIGLTNVKRRLQILYLEAYELNIHESSDSFLVVLKLSHKGQ